VYARLQFRRWAPSCRILPNDPCFTTSPSTVRIIPGGLEIDLNSGAYRAWRPGVADGRTPHQKAKEHRGRCPFWLPLQVRGYARLAKGRTFPAASFSASMRSRPTRRPAKGRPGNWRHGAARRRVVRWVLDGAEDAATKERAEPTNKSMDSALSKLVAGARNGRYFALWKGAA